MRPPWKPGEAPLTPVKPPDASELVPPWQRDGWEESPKEPDPPGYVFGDRIRKMRERLGVGRWPPIILTTFKITPDRGTLQSMKKLKAARKKVLELAAVVRDEAFTDWLRSSVVKAERPDEWTQARELYESYLRQAKNYGINRGDKRLAKEELATETQWGKMMGAEYPSKKRRRNGWYYPVRLKRGA
jgi:hypothetical protein